MKDFFGIGWGSVSAVLLFISGLPYMYGIIKGEIKRPVVSTWILWFLIGSLLLITNFQAGSRANTTLLPMIVGVFNPLIVVVLSAKYGHYKWERSDLVCITICLVTIVIWQTTDSVVIGILGGIVADIFACIPQIKKSWTDPKDEPIFPWLLFSIGSAVNLLAVENMAIQNIAYPAYMTIASFIITAPIIAFRIMEV